MKGRRSGFVAELGPGLEHGHRKGGAQREALDRLAEPEVDENGRMDAAGKLAQLVDRNLQLDLRLLQELLSSRSQDLTMRSSEPRPFLMPS